MNSPKRSRKRAVRLTPEALAALNAALTARWQEDDRAGKLTRETRAELMGVGITTAANMLSGNGADRASFAFAFKKLGIEWSDDLCENPPVEAHAEPVVEIAPTPDETTTVSEVSRRPWWARRRYASGAAFGLLAIGGGLWFGLSIVNRPPAEEWSATFDRLMADGGVRYHRADYVGSRAQIEAALDLARAHDSANRMAFATHVQGMLAEERGDLAEARTRYLSARAIRATQGVDRPNPVADEALGVLETRLGEFAAARHHLELCLAGFGAAHDPVGVAMAQRDLGSVAFRTDDLAGAEAWFGKALGSLKGLSKPDIVEDIRGRRALVTLKRGHAAEARDALEGCLDYWTAKGQVRWVAECEMHLALAEEALNDLTSAKARLLRSKATFERLGDRAGATEAAGALRRLEPNNS